MVILGTVMGGVEFRPMYDDNFLPPGLMVDSMIDGLPSFPPSFDDHSGQSVCYWIFTNTATITVVYSSQDKYPNTSQVTTTTAIRLWL